jgi:hypothetical protein
MSTRDKAACLLGKLYNMRKCDFNPMTVEDILSKATAAEIDFYFYWICEV